LYAAKLCFSPFGYGEVSWRDYEAVMCGSLLIKPDMSHIETRPDIFVPLETYVPVRWDLADLADKVHHYARHEDQRMAITRRAFDVLHRYFRDGQFLEQMRPLFALAGAAPRTAAGVSA
jgi:hypothetical protein